MSFLGRGERLVGLGTPGQRILGLGVTSAGSPSRPLTSPQGTEAQMLWGEPFWNQEEKPGGAWAPSPGGGLHLHLAVWSQGSPFKAWAFCL